MSKAGCIWWAQRVSAVALIPLICWFVFFVLKLFEYRDIEIISSMFVSPFAPILLILFLGLGIYHGTIGIKEIIEDYVHCNAMKITLTILVNFLGVISALVGICSVLVLHLSAFGLN